MKLGWLVRGFADLGIQWVEWSGGVEATMRWLLEPLHRSAPPEGKTNPVSHSCESLLQMIEAGLVAKELVVDVFEHHQRTSA